MTLPCGHVFPSVSLFTALTSGQPGVLAGLRSLAEQPPSPTYDYFKAYLRSADRLFGTTSDCHIPIRLNTGGSMLFGAWQVVAEFCGLIYYACGARGLALVSDTFRDANSGGA
jgi:hypothetical protein